MVADHLGKPGIAQQSSTLGPERIMGADGLHEIERGRCPQQPRHLAHRQIEFDREFIRIARTGAKLIQNVKLDAGCQHLRIDEARYDVEKRPGPAVGDRSG